MEIVISKNETQGHIVNKYKFKVLGNSMPQKSKPDLSDNESKPFTPAENKTETEQPTDAAVMTGSKDELVNSLLQKTDDMSSNFIKLQMKLEAAQEEHKQALEAARHEAFAAGVQEGRLQCETEQQQAKTSGIEQFSASVKTLEESAQLFETGLEGMKEELVHAALDVAKEVISIELNEHSAAIAASLSSELIKELQSASKVTLKVNPQDHGIISEKVGTMAHVELLSDSAVSPGGVIAISDAGNINAEIMKRYERAKRTALSE